VTSSLTSFILPALLFLRCRKVQGKSQLEVRAAWAVLGLGCTIAVLGFASALNRTLHGH
jgi:hypothetical protein